MATKNKKKAATSKAHPKTRPADEGSSAQNPLLVAETVLLPAHATTWITFTTLLTFALKNGPAIQGPPDCQEEVEDRIAELSFCPQY